MIVKKLTTLLDFDLDRASLAAAKAIGKDLKAGLIAASASAIAVGGALLAMVKKTADAGDLAAKTGLRLGLTTEAVQEYGYIAEMSGVKAAEFAAGVARLAKKGGFDDTDKALGALADRFAAMPDGMKKTALAQEYFGRSGAQLITLLNAGSAGIAEMRAEAQALGFVISDEAARGMEAFNDDLSRLQYAGKGLMYTIAQALLPTLSELADDLVTWAKANNALLRQKVAEYTRGIVSGLKDFVRWARATYDRIKPLIDALGGLEGAARKLLAVLILLKAVDLVNNFVVLGSAIAKATVALKDMGAASLVNPIALLAIALIGAGLALEDIQGYTEGKDSVLGSMLDSWDEESGALNYLRTLLAEILADLGLLSKEHRIKFGFEEPSDFVRNFGNKLRRMIDWRMILIAPLAPSLLTIAVLRSAWQSWAGDVGTWISGVYDRAADLAVRVGEAIGETLSDLWTRILALVDRTVDAIREKMSGLGGDVASLVSSRARGVLPDWIADRVLPAAAPASASASPSLTLTAGPVTVNATTGASPAEIGRAVQQAQQDGLAPLLRQAWRTLAPAED